MEEVYCRLKGRIQPEVPARVQTALSHVGGEGHGAREEEKRGTEELREERWTKWPRGRKDQCSQNGWVIQG